MDCCHTTHIKLTQNGSDLKVKLLEENIDVNLHDLGLDSSFLDMLLNTQAAKGKQINWTESKCKAYCFEEYLQESEKTIHRTGENICKAYIW